MWTLIILATIQIARCQFTASKTTLTCWHFSDIKCSSSLATYKNCKQYSYVDMCIWAICYAHLQAIIKGISDLEVIQAMQLYRVTQP